MAERDESESRGLGLGELRAPGEQVNINTAGLAELKRLDRIADDLALQIIEYREQHGPFQRTDDILKVPGIEPDWFDREGEHLTV